MMKFAVTLCSIGIAVAAHSQTIVARYDFEDGGTFNASTDTDAGSVASNFTNGAGLVGFSSSTIGDNSTLPFSSSTATGDVNGSADGALFTGSSADQTTQAGAVTNNDYFTFTITPGAGFTYSFSALQFKLAFTSSNPAPESFFVRSSATGTTDLSIGTITTTRTADGAFQLFATDLSGIGALQNVTAAVEFRIYFYNPDGVTSTTGDRIDKILLEATVIPEPSTYVMIGLGGALLAGGRYLRRRRSV